MYTKHKDESVTLFKWIWRSYIKIALIPLIIIEVVFLSMYCLTSTWIQRETIGFAEDVAKQELIQIVVHEANLIEEQLKRVANMAELYRKQISKRLMRSALMEQEDLERLRYSSEGMYYTYKDREGGGAAVFYTGITPVGEREVLKVAQLLTEQELMKEIIATEPLADSIYINTFDSLNIIYPYFDVISQYTPFADIPTYNFYYEADEKYNPERKIKWTDAYLDPAGQGWMTSVIAPVYHQDFLEGVIGIDVTINTIIHQVLNMDIPWEGYGILIGKDGSILALPPDGEKDWGLTELTSHTYNGGITQDTFKPLNFNLYQMPELQEVTDQILKNNEGFSAIDLNHYKHKISWTSISDTGWKLLIVAPQEKIYEKVTQMKKHLIQLGVYMVLGLALFYFIFYIWVLRNSHRISQKISSLLFQVNDIVKKIGSGEYYQKTPILQIKELKNTAGKLIQMGKQLGDSNHNLLKIQEQLTIREAHLQALINSLDDTIIELNEDGKILNVWASDHDNLAKAFLEGEANCIETLLEGPIVDTIHAKIKKVIQTKIPQTVEYTLETNKGLRWYEARLTLISSETRTLLAAARDITAYKTMEDSIQDS